MEPGQDSWGFNIVRQIKRRTEQIEWASPERTKRLFNISSAGTISGMKELEQGIGLDFVPFLTLRGRRDHESGRNTTKLESGFDLRYRITQGLTATLTVNTDFAQTEVDDQIVNLTRFPVFFPEKRDFFLEDAGIFSFGITGRRENDLIPFFSRRIGLSDGGEPIPIIVGAKITGRIGDVNIGVLDVIQDAEAGVDSKNLGRNW